MHDAKGQLELFSGAWGPSPIQHRDPTPPHVASGTSKAAAQSIKCHALRLRERMLAFYAERGDHGATDEECQIDLGLSGNTQRPRRCELVRIGRLRDSGKRRPTASGCAAIVWVSASAIDESRVAP